MSATLTAPPAAAAEAAPKKSKSKLIVVVALVLVLAGGGYVMLGRGGSSAPQPGEVVPLEAIQVNLEGGHYLRLGLALQLTTKAKEADGSKALDLAIDVFSGRSVAELADPATRRKLKKELTKELTEAYEGEVMGVYLTEFVTQ